MTMYAHFEDDILKNQALEVNNVLSSVAMLVVVIVHVWNTGVLLDRFFYCMHNKFLNPTASDIRCGACEPNSSVIGEAPSSRSLPG